MKELAMKQKPFSVSNREKATNKGDEAANVLKQQLVIIQKCSIGKKKGWDLDVRRKMKKGKKGKGFYLPDSGICLHFLMLGDQANNK